MDFIIDLEFLSLNDSHTAIISMGYGMFNPLDLNPLLEQELVVIDQDKDFNGRNVDWDTIKWHMQLGKEVNAYLDTIEVCSLRRALQDLRIYLEKFRPDRVWTNGIGGLNGDITILEDAYQQYDMEKPWKYNQPSDARTIFKWHGVKRSDWKVAEKSTGATSKHNPLDDCMNCARLIQWCATDSLNVAIGESA